MADDQDLYDRCQAARSGDENAMHDLWEEAIARDIHTAALARLKRRYPQFARLHQDLYGESVLILRAALGSFDPTRAREVTWGILANYCLMQLARDLLRYAAQHSGDGGAVDMPRRVTEAEGFHAEGATTYVDGFPLAEEEGLDPWDWAEVQPEAGNEDALVEWIDRKHEIEGV